MVNGLHILLRNRAKKPLAIALSRARMGVRGRDIGCELSNVQYKPKQNYHYEYSPEYIS
jgi:hypothetical protein